MDKIKILVDSGSDMSMEYAEKYNIDIVPLNVIFEGKTHKDVIELSSTEYCEYLKTCSEIPSTSQPSPMDFIEYFNKYKTEYEHIIVITMSPTGSGTFNSATLAKEMFLEENPDYHIHIVDSKSCGLIELLEAKAAANMIEDGYNIVDILDNLEKIRFNISTYYLVDNVEYLIKGGRVSTIKGTIAAKLRLKPIVAIKSGIGSNLTNAVGYHNGIEKMAGFFFAEAKPTTTLYISHANCPDKAMKLVERVKKQIPELKYEILPMNCVMATQSGPDSIGMFYEKNL